MGILGCKAFLCEPAFNNLPDDIKAQWRYLTDIKDKYLDAKPRQIFKDRLHFDSVQ